MAYRLKVDERVSTGIRRLIIEEIDYIVDQLVNPEIDRDLGIHEARKSCKRVRAALRLVRDEIGKPLYRQENIRFRDAARKLAGARDTWVKIQVFDRLTSSQADEFPEHGFGKFRKTLLKDYENTLAIEQRSRNQITGIVETMQDAVEEIRDLPVECETFSAFEGGLKRVYTRGRAAFNLCSHQPTPENFHEWRKRVKYLWHQVEILMDMQPASLGNLAEDLHTLSDHLGDQHDLVVLRGTTKERTFAFDDEDEYMILVGWIDERRLALEVLSLTLGARLFRKPGDDFVEIMRKYWQAWRSGGMDSGDGLSKEIH
jgi:CHAD domain-containing protein